VITLSVFKTSGAAQGFRRFLLPPNPNKEDDNKKKTGAVPFRILQVDDFSSMQPFEGATNRTAAFVMQKGTPNRYPVDYTVWKKTTSRNIPFKASLPEAIPLLKQEQVKAKPVDQRDETSAWITVPAKALTAVNKVLGVSDYKAFAGAYSGGANAVYWLKVLAHNQDGTVRVHNIVDGAKREIRDDDHDLEADLLYPLLRGREVHKWGVNPEHSARFLMVQDTRTRRGIPERDLTENYPRTMAYFKKYRTVLESRAAYKRYFKKTDPFYSMFNVADYTFAQIKVVWAEQGAFGCAVITANDGKILIPDHKIMLIPFDDEPEAHYLCALANSSVFGFAVSAYSINIQQDPHVFQNVRIPKFDRAIDSHRKLALLSMQAHEVAHEGELGEIRRIEKAVDLEAAKVWGLTSQELKAIDEALGRA
jgi:hypothetical protein